jgi:hypothetical protein
MQKRTACFFLNFAFCIFNFSLAPADYQAVEVRDGGTIQGLVKFPGETPARAMFINRTDPQCPRGIAQNHLLVKQENFGLQNALAILEIDAGKALSVAKAELRDEHCMFAPRLQWVPKNTSLVLRNTDSALHNVHAWLNGVSVFNVDLPAGAPPVRRPLVLPGLYRVNCDRHFWMRAWIYASESPYVAITDAQGHFTLSDVPPGHYVLRVWHEGWTEKGKDSAGRIDYQPMEQVLSVEVKPQQTTDVVFDDLQPTF